MNADPVRTLTESVLPLSDTQLMGVIVLAIIGLMWKMLDVIGRNKRK